MREIENGLLANHDRLYHLGMEIVSKSTLGEAMNRRDPEISKALFDEILDRALRCSPRHKFRFHNLLYAIDSTTIDPGCQSARKYSGELRLIEFWNESIGKTYRFITNNFKLAASGIGGIYKQRWQIEVFFKWLKQNLKIKSFLGTSENAVMTQIYVALIHYLLVANIKFSHGFKLGFTELTNRIRDTLMQHLSLLEILALDRKTI